jgi:DNA-binding GntR family transcriptional regulator
MIMAEGKHVTLATELEKDISAGKYGWEGGLPSAGELAQKWNVSINTVKNALALLEGRGTIEKRGASYFVNRIPTTMTQYVPPAHVRLPRGGFCKNLGPVTRTTLPEHLAKKLDLSPTAQAVYRVQVSGEMSEGSEKPLQISYRYHLLPLTNEKVHRMGTEPGYDPMWGDAEVPVELMSRDEIAPRLATEGERDLLNLPETTPVSGVVETIRDTSGTILMVQELVLSPRTTLIFDFPFTNRP